MLQHFSELNCFERQLWRKNDTENLLSDNRLKIAIFSKRVRKCVNKIFVSNSCRNQHEKVRGNNTTRFYDKHMSNIKVVFSIFIC